MSRVLSGPHHNLHFLVVIINNTDMSQRIGVHSLGDITFSALARLGPRINGLVTDGNTKLCCRGFILVLFHSTAANKIDSEHTRDYKRLLPVCEAEILRATVKIIEMFSSFYVDF